MAKLIEVDSFPFEFLSQIGERESWRKEIHRPVYHVHKWWAKRLGSVFRGILLGCELDESDDITKEFYHTRPVSSTAVFDPFMGSGTTIGEAHKLGLKSLGRDINPVATNAVKVALGPMNRRALDRVFKELDRGVGRKIRELYITTDRRGRPCDVLYYFWVMQVGCPDCQFPVDLFSSYVIARNAYPKRKPEIQVVCPQCGWIFQGIYTDIEVECTCCAHRFVKANGPANGSKASCVHCNNSFVVAKTIQATDDRPTFKLFGKLVLTCDNQKQYLMANSEDLAAFAACERRLAEELGRNSISIPSLRLADGFNTRQAIGYNFRSWRDFFNSRQLLALGWLSAAINQIEDGDARRVIQTLFSGLLEFNNLFASYKGEGTGAVRHMFSHHILKPERTPLEANVWGTPKSSGSFLNLFKSRLLRALQYREEPIEIYGNNGTKGKVCSEPFSGQLMEWPSNDTIPDRGIAISCGDSAESGLQSKSVDLVVTDPPFFDNVHYSELADFFYAWQQLEWQNGDIARSTRHSCEVQDTKVDGFTKKLQDVFRECHRVMVDNGLLVFTYHHSRNEGWEAVANAVLGAGFVIVNSHPVKSEMSVATPKSQAKEPIQLDIILVCRKKSRSWKANRVEAAMIVAEEKLIRLRDIGLKLSANDCRIVMFGQLLTTLSDVYEIAGLGRLLDARTEGTAIAREMID
ncbi:MAG: hypothetical protein IT427_06985 [Pirellulales bacterium]|nr:hypothetical protein [Pirellulales bacterium]